MSYTYDPSRPVLNGSYSPPPTYTNAYAPTTQNQIYQTATPNSFSKFDADNQYMYSSIAARNPSTPGYRSVSLLNPQASDVQRGHIGTQENGDILIQVSS